MVIGTNSKSTIFDLFQTGIREVIRSSGLPLEVCFESQNAEIHARSKDFKKRVDFYRIKFLGKEGLDPHMVSRALDEAKVPNHVVMEEHTCVITLPRFDWSQVARLAPVDTVIENYAAVSLRSRSWTVKVMEYKRHGLNINALIEKMQETNSSDIHLRAGAPPYVRIDGDLKPLDLPALSASDMEEMVFQLGGPEEVAKLDAERETSFQYHLAGVGYLRCSGYIKMNAMALAIRFIPERPLSFEQLMLPDAIKKVTEMHRGLFLVCGVTGSGKSTTLASLIDLINETRHSHIITAEDPIEFVYSDKKSIISQRQVGRDTHTFANALRGALREDPDVILVGEMRDRETIRAALSAAATGHLVLSTLHTMTAVDTVNRIISYFPPEERDVIRQELAFTLTGVCCQRLLRKIGGGRIPCVELLLAHTPMVKDAILEGDIGRLYAVMEVDSEMKTFDQYAVELYRRGLVDEEEARSACSDEEGFKRIMTGIQGRSGRLLA